ncbi:hypothetical protein HK405_012561, partial [Cladochytrium tenue]
SEYIADCDARRAFISGFTGSAGLVAVTTTEAALWTDGRYFLQASQQLDSNWSLQKSGIVGVPTKEEWLVKALPSGSRVGIDPTLITIAAARTLSEALSKAGQELVSVSENLVDGIWEDRPSAPGGKVFHLAHEYSGRSASEKIENLRDAIAAKEGVWGFMVTALDEVAWLLNLRGSDIAYNPVFFAYVLVTKSDVYLFVDESKLEDAAKVSLQTVGVKIRPYECSFEDLKRLVQEAPENEKLWVDSRCSLALQDAIGGPNKIEEARSPVQTAKAIKNSTEIQGFRDCHIRDASALCEYFAWLEEELVEKGNKSISEVDAADKLEALR